MQTPMPKMQSLGYQLHGATRLLKREFERRARVQTLTLLQWRVLGKLAQDDGLTQTALAAKVEASPMTISDILDRLEGQGLVRREPDPSDSRAKLVWITEAAQPTVKVLRAIAEEVYAKALAGIPAADQEVLMRSLEKIVANLEAPTPETADDETETVK